MWARARIAHDKLEEWEESMFLPLPGATRGTVRPDDIEDEHEFFAANM